MRAVIAYYLVYYVNIIIIGLKCVYGFELGGYVGLKVFKGWEGFHCFLFLFILVNEYYFWV
jgi:hypothetical protein